MLSVAYCDHISHFLIITAQQSSIIVGICLMRSKMHGLKVITLNGFYCNNNFHCVWQVDFGAATGQDGAFGWYSDHPTVGK